MKRFFRAATLITVAALIITVFAACSCRPDQTKKIYVVKDFHSEVQNADYSNPEVSVEINDFKSMNDFMEGFQIGDYDGKVIKITGVNRHYGNTCSITQQKDNGSSIGVTWEVLDGTFPDDYPDNNVKITISGVVEITKENGYRAIEVLKSNLILEK